MSVAYKCHHCGAKGLKLWREYQTFLDRTDLLCAACIEKQAGEKLDPADPATGGLVPAVLTKDGTTFWGYTSAPFTACERWWALRTYEDPAREIEWLQGIRAHLAMRENLSCVAELAERGIEIEDEEAGS